MSTSSRMSPLSPPADSFIAKWSCGDGRAWEGSRTRKKVDQDCVLTLALLQIHDFTMSGRIPIGSAVLLTGVITAIGYSIMALTTPTDQEMYDRLSPDLKRKVDEARRMQAGAQNELARESKSRLDAIRAQAQNDSPVWADSEPKK